MQSDVSVRLFRLLWVGVFLAVLAGTGAGGGVASAQAASYYYGELDSTDFIREADNERTNVRADGLMSSSYNVPYIELTAGLFSAATAVKQYSEVGQLVLPRGFTHARAALELSDRFISWDCSADTDVLVETSNASLSILFPGDRASSFQDAILPYAREVTLVDDPSIDGEVADEKVCVAPEALEESFFYKPDGQIGNANQGRGRSPTSVAAYMPPTGQLIGSHEIIYPADDATMTHTRIMYDGELPTEYSYAQFASAPTAGRLIADPYQYSAVFHADGSLFGNGFGTLSFSCTGGTVAGTADNSWCDREYTVTVLVPPPEFGGAAASVVLPLFDAETSGSTASVSCAFQADGLCRDVIRSADYLGDTLLAGSTHDFAIKAYSETPFSALILGIGASEVGAPVGTTDLVVTVGVVEDYSATAGYRLGNISYSNNEAQELFFNAQALVVTHIFDTITVPANNSNITLTREPCSPRQPEQCLVVSISDLTFLKTFSQPIYTITAVNTEAQQTTRYAR